MVLYQVIVLCPAVWSQKVYIHYYTLWALCRIQACLTFCLVQVSNRRHEVNPLKLSLKCDVFVFAHNFFFFFFTIKCTIKINHISFIFSYIRAELFLGSRKFSTFCKLKCCCFQHIFILLTFFVGKNRQKCCNPKLTHFSIRYSNNVMI